MKKDVLFALELGMKVAGSFILMTYIGVKLNEYFNNKMLIVVCIAIAFIYVMKILLEVGKNG